MSALSGWTGTDEDHHCLLGNVSISVKKGRVQYVWEVNIHGSVAVLHGGQASASRARAEAIHELSELAREIQSSIASIPVRPARDPGTKGDWRWEDAPR